jgi:hypothetical protein
VDSSGNVIVTGSSKGDYYTAKYAAADGALLWEQRYNGPANSHDFAHAVAVDGSGNVIVTGDSFGSGSGADFNTAKYAGANGALLWEKRYNGPVYNDDHASAVAVDNSGNIIVTGTSLSDSPDLGLGFGFYTAYSGGYTAKYSARGALLWETRYSGIYCRSIGAALAVDTAGNAIVAGHYYNCNAGGDPNESYAAKYAAADGALLWEKRDDGKGTAALAVDGDGNVIVTGSGSNDYYTAKYAAADGALLWEKRFTGPTSLSYSSHCLALSSDGMVVVTGNFATVVYREAPTVSIDLVPTGVRLRFTGVPGRSYNTERAPAVTGPWNTINTQTAPASGLFEYLDTNSPAAAAFYRTSEP